MPDQPLQGPSSATHVSTVVTSNAPGVTSLPPDVKHGYDEIVKGITASSNAAKKRKRTQYQSMSAFERLISTSKHFPRGVHPFFDIGLVMMHGTESQWGPPPDANSPALSKEAIGAFDKLFAVAPELLLVVKQFYIEIMDKAEQWEQLTITMREAATSTRTTDTNGIKHKLSYFLPNPLKQALSPPVPEQELKSDCGLAQPILRYYIVGYKDRLKLPSLRYTPAPDVEQEQEGGSSSDDQRAAERLLQKIVAGKYQLKYKPYPSFLYKDSKFDPNNLDAGLLHSDTVLRFLRHIWLGPSAALSGAEKISKTCNTSLHNVKKVTPARICYAVVQARTTLGTSEWTPRDGKYSFKRLFNSILKLFTAEPEHPWVIDVLEWYQSQMFQNVDFDSDAEQDKDSDDEDDVLAQRRRRAAAAIGS
ncbi:hypothetical protein R3P38DRAFT_3168050 [Favolaschia claudopus]|uniref:Uncharacterized protein n=1 Tax=Favolaschia claudopus TaxID=2862362 RepID=A0AAW0E5C0_9AGAR